MSTITFVPPITSPIFTEDFDDFMPLGVLALASSLRAAGHSPVLYRPTRRLFEDGDYEEVVSEILEFESPIIGFSTWCHSYPSSILLAKKIKERDSSRNILFGGPQATILDRETMATFPFVDFVLRGEADLTVVDCVEAILTSHPERLASVPGLSFRPQGSSTNIYRNEMLPNISDLDSLPIPAYDLLTPNSERPISLDVGRGCPFKCTFCTTNDFFSKSYRVKTAKRIITEIEHLQRTAGANSFDFTHDMFTLNRKFLMPFLKELSEYREEKRNWFEWSCSARVDCVDRELLQAMFNAGCRGIFFGIESGSDRMQKIIKKHIRIAKGFSSVDDCIAVGMRATTAFIAGFPEEERCDIDATLRAAIEMGAKGAKPQMSLLSLLPQTPLYDQHKASLEYDNSFSDFSGAVLSRPERLMVQELPELFSSFYYLPVPSAKRETLVSLGRLVNHLQGFRVSLAVLRNDIVADDSSLLIDRFEALFEEKKPDVQFELLALIRWLEEIVERLPDSRSQIVRSIVVAEAAAAVAKRIFVKQQVISPASQLIRLDDFSWERGDQLAVGAHWSLINVPTELETLTAELASGGPSIKEIDTTFDYLVVATNERASALWRLNGRDRKSVV